MFILFSQLFTVTHNNKYYGWCLKASRPGNGVTVSYY